MVYLWSWDADWYRRWKIKTRVDSQALGMKSLNAKDGIGLKVGTSSYGLGNRVMKIYVRVANQQW